MKIPPPFFMGRKHRPQMIKGISCGIAILLFATISIGCQSAPTSLPSTTSPTPLRSPLQSPLSIPADLNVPLPTQDPNLGSVKGIYLVAGQPEVGRILYLAGVVKDASGKETAVGFERSSPLRTTTQSDGSFRFVNVPPGKYAIVVDVIVNAFMMNDPKSGKDLLVEIVNGSQVDLGTLDHPVSPGK
jgi:hypothetical protein